MGYARPRKSMLCGKCSTPYASCAFAACSHAAAQMRVEAMIVKTGASVRVHTWPAEASQLSRGLQVTQCGPTAAGLVAVACCTFNVSVTLSTCMHTRFRQQARQQTKPSLGAPPQNGSARAAA